MRLSAFVGLAQWKAVGVGERLCRASLRRDGGGPTHLGIVLAAWDPVASAASVDLVRNRLCGMANVRTSMVVVANNDAAFAALSPADGEYEIMAGSNREAEFSAYEEGRQRLRSLAAPGPDVWLILNDRLPFYGADCLCAVTPASLAFAASTPIAAGTIDFLPHYLPVWDHRLKCYIRSNFIMLSAAAIDQIGPLCTVRADEYELRVPVSFPGPVWPLSDWLGPAPGDFLREFLTGPEGWTRAEPVTTVSWPRLRMKALSIVNEWLLSLRLIDAHVPLVPWRLARAMSGLSTSKTFSQTLVSQYTADPCFGGALEWSPKGRLQLAAAVLAGRVGATELGSAFLSYAATSSAGARA